MFESLIKALGLDPNDRAIKRYRERVEGINALEAEISCRRATRRWRLPDRRVSGKARRKWGRGWTTCWKKCSRWSAKSRVRQPRPSSFRCSAHRRHWCSTQGKIAEMKTGEGKTLVATLPAYPQRPERQGRPYRHGQ
ncbi:MAG: hypothetical protein MZU95_07675 [Desulfomicrobium escambiense]|nr:hypothetical protein [Desulfomicrobium escambiense]